MSERTRGQEKTIRFIVEGKPVSGSWLKITDFEHRPDTDIKKTSFLGEAQKDGDVQHSGHDLSWTQQELDAQLAKFLDELIRREEEHEPPQKVRIQVLTTYRDPALPTRTETYYGGVLKVDSNGFRGREEYNEFKMSAFFKHRRAEDGELL